jgi:hypothetical protein
VAHTDPNVRSHKILFNSNPDADTRYSCFAYLNYDTESDALAGKRLFETAIFDAITNGAPIDASRMTVCMKSDAPRRTWTPVFSVWVGNLFNASHQGVILMFNPFGRLATMKTHGVPPLKITETQQQRSAIINFVHYADAQRALVACAAGGISFGSVAAIARPRSNIQIVKRVAGILRARPDKTVTFEHVQSIAERMGGGERPGDCVTLLRACPNLFSVDHVNMLVTVANYYYHS